MDSNTLCKIRDTLRAIAALEQHFEKTHALNLNEAMLLCSLCEVDHLTSGEIAEKLAISCSNCSKVISSCERKGLVSRQFGTVDKRQSFISITPDGRNRLAELKADHVALPDCLQ
ncbi:MAG: winged helix-turn-helix transcriptional regulator [Bacteroidaceae bacterium]|nr:winged helix-turn-helix transcriptional regulator [Bacteroidaceae bacterium]